MKRTVKILCMFLFLIMLLPSIVNASKEPEVKRLFGKSRVETSLEISKEAYKSAKNVVLVGYNGEVDALTGSLIATYKDAPVLFVNEKHLKEIKERLVELGTEKVYILGGERVFSAKLAKEFQSYNPTRIKGNNRFETAVNIAKSSVGKTSNEVFLALGVGVYADALAVGPISAKNQMPIFLTQKDNLPKETKDALVSMGVKKVNIVGGHAGISKSIENELKKLNIKVDRTSGSSRESTAIAISEKFNKQPSGIIVANGYSYTDAVVGGYFAAKNNAVLLLSKSNDLNYENMKYISDNKLNTFILGGSNIIGSNVVETILDNNYGKLVVDSFNIKDITFDSYDFIKVNLDREVDLGNAKITIKGRGNIIEPDSLYFNMVDNSLLIGLESSLVKDKYTITISGVTNKDVISTIDLNNKVVNVSTENQLKSSLEDETINRIVLQENISVSGQLSINNPILIEGNNKTITALSIEMGEYGDNVYDTIAIHSDDVTINNLTVQNSTNNNISFTNSKNGKLKNVTLKNAWAGGLYLYSSIVEVENITATENYWYGIGLSIEDIDSPHPQLTVLGTYTYKSPKYEDKDDIRTPAIILLGTDHHKDWLVNVKGYIEEALSENEYNYYDKKEYINWPK